MSLATIAPFGFDDINTLEVLKVYRELGCEQCQYYRNETNEPSVGEVLDVVGAPDLKLDSIHGVFGDAYDPSSLDEKTRKQSIDVYAKEGELAITLGGPMVVVHPSPIQKKSQVAGDGEVEARHEALLKSMETLAEIGESLGVVYLFENQPGNAWLGNDPVEMADMIRVVNSDWLKMCFDVGHAHILKAAESLEGMLDVVRYLHVHDNDGVTDSHDMPQEGCVAWERIGEILNTGNMDTSFMLEVFYSPERMNEYLNDEYRKKLYTWRGFA